MYVVICLLLPHRAHARNRLTYFGCSTTARCVMHIIHTASDARVLFSADEPFILFLLLPI